MRSFLLRFNKIHSALFSHGNRQQPLRNDDLDIALEIAKATPPIAVILLFLLLLVPLTSVLPDHVLPFTITAIIGSSKKTTSH